MKSIYLTFIYNEDTCISGIMGSPLELRHPSPSGHQAEVYSSHMITPRERHPVGLVPCEPIRAKPLSTSRCVWSQRLAPPPGTGLRFHRRKKSGVRQEEGRKGGN